MPIPASDAAAAAEWVFTGHQVDKYEIRAADSEDSWDRIRLVIEVTHVYKGDVPATLELATGYGGSDCGVDLSQAGEVGLTLSPRQDGTVPVNSCGGVYDADEIRLLYEPLPAGTGSGAPGFVVGTEIGPARVAILDQNGVLLSYAPGEGRLASAAVCPGAGKIVEMVQADGAWEVGGEHQPYLEIRDAETLQIEDHYDLDISARDLSQLNGMGWVLDLQCHDPEAELTTYLLPRGSYDAQAGANLPGAASLHIWRSGELSIVPAGEARSVAVDAEQGVFYAITGPEGTTLDRRDLDGELLESSEVPLGYQAWKLSLSSDHSKLAILARDQAMDRDNWAYAEVNSLLLIDVSTGRAQTYSLPRTGFASLLEARDAGFATAVYEWDPSTVTVASVGDGAVDDLGSYPADGLFEPIAIGSRALLLTEPGSESDPAVVAIDPASGEATPVADLVRSRTAVAFPGPLPGTATPVPTTTSSPPPTTAAPTTTSSPVALGSTTPPDHQASGWTVPSLLGGAILLALVVIFMVRRRRIA